MIVNVACATGKAIGCGCMTRARLLNGHRMESRAWLGKWNGSNCIFGISKDLSVEKEAQQRFERLFPAIILH